MRKTAYPNIILITVDALRADHLSCYGYQRKTSPNIDNLGKNGVIFLNCFSTSSITISSFPGLLTGRYLTTFKYEPDWNNVLDRKFTTLAEYLKNFGYYSRAFIFNGIFEGGKGFEQGFDYFHVYLGAYIENTKQVTSDVVDFLQNSRPKNKPYFVWIHYLGPHAPYRFHEEYFKIFEGDRLYKEKDKILKLKPDNLQADKFLQAWQSKGYIPPMVFHEGKFSLSYYIACYDANILYTDFYIGNLLRNIEDNTIIILTSDHGESLGEHNRYFCHGEYIYDELLRIPLIIKDNRSFKGKAKILKAVSAVDIVPTILNRINPIWYFLNKWRFDGIDLRLILNNSARRRCIYSYFGSPPYCAYSIRDVNKNIKYILSAGNNKEELYILPDENNNLINEGSLYISSFKKELSKNLRRWLRDYPIRSDINARRIPLTEDQVNNLRSLGYLH